MLFGNNRNVYLTSLEGKEAKVKATIDSESEETTFLPPR